MSAPAQLNASLAGRYKIEREIGQGGMATVYLAQDIKHQRRVALKVLSPELGAVLGGERFLAEIRVTANLQHPNILPLFDSGEAEGLLFYVMPYVEGESLRGKLEREKQLPVDEAVRLTVALASALDYAHRHAVIHRDLKPENILLHEGQPLIADFGIALAVSNAGGNRITQTGLSLGTPQYMSPEQATGDRQLDGRSDIYSLGAVLYEMLTGEAPHSGPTAQSVIAKVITDKPRSIRLSRDTVPEEIEYAVERALAKLPADRWPTAQQFGEALQGRAVVLPSGITTPGSPRRLARGRSWRERGRDPLVLSLAALLVASLATIAWFTTRGARNDVPTMRLSLALPTDGAFVPGSGLAISSDGQTIVYNGRSAPSLQLVVRRLEDLGVRPLPGTLNAVDPAISPDGRWVAFIMDRKVRKISIDGGPAIAIMDAAPGGVAWVSNDSLIAVSGRVLQLVSANGGEAQPLTTLDTLRGERVHRNPRAIGDGNTVFFQAVGADGARLGMLSLNPRKATMLEVEGSDVLGMVDDVLVYVSKEQTAMAVRIDLDRQRTVGAPIPLGQRVPLAQGGGEVARAALSRSGTLVYQTGSDAAQLSLVDLRGRVTPMLPDFRRPYQPRFSRDGRMIAVTIGTDVWVYDIASGTPTKLTSRGENDRAEWTPDGKRVLYRSTRAGLEHMWWQPADGSAPAEPLLRLKDGPQEAVVSSDGKWLVFRADFPLRQSDVYFKRLTGDTILYPIAVTEFRETMPRLSRDDKWVAYVSDESGTPEVYVRPFPGPGGKVKVSVDGGREPVWSPDGRKIYYRKGREMMAATVSSTAAFSVVGREKLFEGDFLWSGVHANFDVSPNGRELLMIAPADGERQLMVVYNWAREVRERLRGRN